MQVKNVKETIEEIDRHIKRKLDFKFMKFGDGTLRMIDGWKGRKENQFNSDEVERLLKVAFKNNSNMIALPLGGEEGDTLNILAPPHSDSYVEKLKGIVKKYKPEKYNQLEIERTYYYTDVFPFYYVYKREEFEDYMKSWLKSRRVQFVGGKHLAKEEIWKVFYLDDFVTTPSRQAYEKVGDIMERIDEDCDITLFACGHTSKIIQNTLDINSIDIGSLADAVIGKKSRGWIKTAKKNGKI